MPQVRFTPIFSENSSALAWPRQRWSLLVLLLGAMLSSVGCSSVSSAVSGLSRPETLFGLIEPYRTEVVQGNVVTKEDMAQVQPGLTRAQVREMLGAPILSDIFHDNRWDYIFTIAKQGIAAQQRRVSLFFKGDVLERVEADHLPTERAFVTSVERSLKAVVSDNPDLSPAQLNALPVPDKNVATRKVPQGAERNYPPLETVAP